jgi:ferric-dicitrate binding protein FerR (iron transport regulator)
MDGLDWTIIARYLDDSCTDAERDTVERWASQSLANQKELEALRRTWTQSALLPSGRRIDAMYAKLSARMRAPALNVVKPETPERAARSRNVPAPRPLSISPPPAHARPVRFARSGAIAATILVAASVAGGSYLTIRRGSATDGASPFVREYATERGQKATIQLSDGSQLTLAAASRVSIPADFGKASREITLEGEAFVDVAHDPARPFRIHIKDAIAEDIGTRFDVRSYPQDSSVVVAVEEGAVTLGQSPVRGKASGRATVPEGVVLHQGDVGTLSPDGHVKTTTGTPGMYSSWMRGNLTFVRSPLSDVADAIGRWYDLDVRVDSPTLAAETVTASFSVQSPAQMVQALALAVNARVEMNGRVVRLISTR